MICYAVTNNLIIGFFISTEEILFTITLLFSLFFLKGLDEQSKDIASILS